MDQSKIEGYMNAYTNWAKKL